MNIIHHDMKDGRLSEVTFNTSYVAPSQPIPQVLISIDSTSTSFAGDMSLDDNIISQDYTQETRFSGPPRPDNPSISALPFSKTNNSRSSPIYQSPSDESPFTFL
ncbi:hypothetical protein QTN25_003458 [Entamoeba marina]